MSRVLVTGGSGFVGSHLVDRWLNDGHEVVVVDDLSTGSRRNLAHLPEGRITFIEGSVEDTFVLEKAMEGVDLIFHLAAAVGVFEVIRRPLSTLLNNIRASEQVFEFGSERGIRTVFTSTSEVYGKNDADRLREDDDSIFGSTQKVRWTYALSKAADEFIALAFHRERGYPITIARLFNTTGPRQSGSYGMVVPRFVRQAITGEPVTIHGDGNQTRCFTNVFDCVEALTRLATTDASIGQVVNVGQPSEVSIRELAELVRELAGSPSEIRYVPYDEAYGLGFEDMRRRVPDVSLLSRLTGFAPNTPLEVTIGQIIAEQRKAAA
jgi:UDP-glucose 4-epimerase